MKSKLVYLAIAAVLALASMAGALVPAQAAAPHATTPKQVVVTEAQINASYWVTNPVRRSVSNKHVTLGDGTVTISATITHRDGTTLEAQSVWKPFVNAQGALVFNFQSATVSGQPANVTDRRELILAHQTRIHYAIREYVRKQVGGAFRYTKITVTPGQVVIDVNVLSQ
ncbi:MAG: hypothetical protein IT324_08690 [Anaerolineae bacterium]|nr:hypothetical protein [Anaerolineae bacterium]